MQDAVLQQESLCMFHGETCTVLGCGIAILGSNGAIARFQQSR